MAGLVEKDFRLIWCNKQALIFLLIIGVVIGLQNEAVILGLSLIHISEPTRH